MNADKFVEDLLVEHHTLGPIMDYNEFLELVNRRAFIFDRDVSGAVGSGHQAWYIVNCVLVINVARELHPSDMRKKQDFPRGSRIHVATNTNKTRALLKWWSYANN